MNQSTTKRRKGRVAGLFASYINARIDHACPLTETSSATMLYVTVGRDEAGSTHSRCSV